MKIAQQISEINRRNAKKQWAGYSSEERERLLNETLLNPDVRMRSTEARRAGLVRSWANLPPEARAKRIEAAAEGVRRAREQKSMSMSRYWDGKTPAEREEHYKRTMGSDEGRAKVAESVQRRWDEATPEEREAWLKGSSHSEKARLGRIANWNKMSEVEKREWVRVHLRRIKWKMTDIEVSVAKILHRHFPKEWRYNGCRNCNVTIGGRIPDFINVNGQKSVIECFSVYWHPPEDEPERVQHYAKFGFKCVVLWEDECYNREKVLEKVKAYGK